jgi:Tfp pilus assembly protein PilX
MKKNNNTKNGFALYTAVVVTGILILISYVTANLASKELLLSVSGADSHTAFYNTDSGFECAMYWDLKNPNAVPPGSVSAFDANNPAPPPITCNGVSAPITSALDTLGNPTRTFQISLPQGCSTVKVTKFISGVNTGTTLIESRGYNACSGSHRLERGVKIQY